MQRDAPGRGINAPPPGLDTAIRQTDRREEATRMPLDVPDGLPILVAAAVVLVAGLVELSLKGRARADRTAATMPIVFVWRHKGF